MQACRGADRDAPVHVTRLGDAIRAMTPALGRGAYAAIGQQRMEQDASPADRG